MTTFYDLKNRPHSLRGVDNRFTYLYSLEDCSEIKIANDSFSVIFKPTRNELKIPRNSGWPIGEAHV